MRLPAARFCLVVVAAIGLLSLPVCADAAQIAIAWSDNALNEDGFAIERRVQAGGAFAQLTLLGPNAAAYIDSSVVAGTAYCYRVRAYNAVGASGYSNEACGTPSAAAGASLTVTLPKTTYLSTETMVLTVNAVGGLVNTPIDAYVVVQDASGGYMSLQMNGGLVPGLVPIARGIVLPTVNAPFGLPLAGAPPGSYTWLAALTSPGSLTVVSPIVSTPFTIVR